MPITKIVGKWVRWRRSYLETVYGNIPDGKHTIDRLMQSIGKVLWVSNDGDKRKYMVSVKWLPTGTEALAFLDHLVIEVNT